MKFLEIEYKTVAERINLRYIPPFHGVDFLNIYVNVVLCSEEFRKILTFSYYSPSVIFRKF